MEWVWSGGCEAWEALVSCLRKTPPPLLLACVWGARTLNRWTWVSSVSYLHQRNLNVHLYFGASLYRSQRKQRGNALWPQLIRAQLVDNPSCRLGTGDMKRSLCILPWCSCLRRDTWSPYLGVLSHPRGVKKAARQGALCSVWELLALHDLELPPEKQFYFCSASLPFKQVYSFYSGSYLPLFLCIHQLFVCCWICNCSWCHSWI